MDTQPTCGPPQIDDGGRKTFHWADYLIFAVFLAVSAGIGFYHGYRDKKKQSNTDRDFLLGGGKVPFGPVAFSMQASFLSAIFVLSIPAEFYTYGTMYIYLVISYLIGIPLAAVVYMPLYYKMKITSAYEYLERRFNKTVRVLGSITFMFMTILYMAVVIYTPSLALEQVTGLPLLASVFILGIICTFYTTLGGMKATVWNDLLQMLIVLLGFIILTAFGMAHVGFTNVFTIAHDGGRIIFDDFRFHPHVRHSFWSVSIGAIFISLVQYAASQTIIQKFLSCKNVSAGQKATFFAAGLSTLYVFMVMIMGLTIYAYYHDCDPLAAGRVSKTDQIVPIYVMDVIGQYHGLPGLFIATAFSAALSSVSGGVNALAAVLLEDFVKPVYKWRTNTEIGQRTGGLLSRAFALFFGILVTFLAILSQYMGQTVLQIALSIFGFVGGPLLALLTIGIVMPFVNSWGAGAGLIASLGICCWIGIGTIVSGIKPTPLPVNITGCPLKMPVNCTNWVTTPSALLTTVEMTTATPETGFTVMDIYKISYMWYGLIAMVVSVVVAVPVSCITGNQDAGTMDPGLFYPITDKWCCCCPESCKAPCRCGVPNQDDLDHVQNVNDGAPLTPVHYQVDEDTGVINIAFKHIDSDKPQPYQHKPVNGLDVTQSPTTDKELVNGKIDETEKGATENGKTAFKASDNDIVSVDNATKYSSNTVPNSIHCQTVTVPKEVITETAKQV